MDHERMNAKRLFCVLVIFGPITAIIAWQLMALEDVIRPDVQCVTVDSVVARVEYCVRLITRQFLVIWIMYHVHRLAALRLERRRRPA